MTKRIEELEKALAEAKAEQKRKNHKQKMLDYITKNGSATMDELLKVTQCSLSNSKRYLKMLIDEGLVHSNRQRPVLYLSGKGDSQGYKTSQEVSEAVLEYVSAHMGEKYSAHKIADDLGLPYSSVYKELKSLIKRKLVPEGFNKPVEAAPRTSKEEVAEQPQVDPLFAQIEFLTWTYVRETRSTDLLQFLTWLEHRSKSEA